MRMIAHVALTCFAVFIAGSQHAPGQIIWDTPQGVTGASDISLSGTYFDAVGGLLIGGSTVAVNPTTSVVFNDVTGSGNTFADASGDIAFSSTEGIGSDQPFGETLATDYYNALTGVAYVGHGGTPLIGTVTLSNLTKGDNYQLEIWQATPEGKDGDTDTIYTSGLNSVTTTGFDYVLGNFNATSNSLSFTYTGATATGEINAIELRDLGAVPEPNVLSLSMAGLGMMAFFLIAAVT